MLRTTTHPVAHTHRGKSTITGLGWRAQDASPPTVPPPNTLSGENQAAKTSLSKPMGGRFEKSRLTLPARFLVPYQMSASHASAS